MTTPCLLFFSIYNRWSFITWKISIRSIKLFNAQEFIPVPSQLVYTLENDLVRYSIDRKLRCILNFSSFQVR